jgi:hypothetical protein
MDNKEIIKKAFEYNKKGIETYFEAVETFQAKAEEYAGKAIADSEYVPEQGKTFVRTWIDNRRKLRTGFRDAWLKGHDRIQSLITTA